MQPVVIICLFITEFIFNSSLSLQITINTSTQILSTEIKLYWTSTFFNYNYKNQRLLNNDKKVICLLTDHNRTTWFHGTSVTSVTRPSPGVTLWPSTCGRSTSSNGHLDTLDLGKCTAINNGWTPVRKNGLFTQEWQFTSTQTYMSFIFLLPQKMFWKIRNWYS